MKTKRTSSLLSVNFNNDDEILRAVQGLHLYRSVLKADLERVWYTSIAWYKGNQHLIWNDRNKSLEAPPAPDYRVRMIANKIQPLVRTVASKLYKGTPEWDVVPARTDTESMHTAQIASMVLTNNWYNLRMPEKMLQMMHWLVTCGNVFVKQVWDPDIGLPLSIPDGFFDADEEYEDLYTGDIVSEIVSPFKKLIDPNAETYDEAYWSVESKPVHVEVLADKHPKARDLKEVHNSTTMGQNWIERIKHMRSSVNGPQLGYTHGIQNDTITVHEIYVKPHGNGKFKKGAFAIVAGNMVLQKGDHPYSHGELPYAHVYEIDVPGRVWATSTLEQLLPLQQSYNRTRSQGMEIRNIMSAPKWLVPKGSGVKNDALTGQPGEIIEHNPTLAPTMVSPPSMPSNLDRLIAQDTQDMEDISGIHEVSNAQAPGQVRGTGGIMALLEADDTKLAPVTRQIEYATARMGRQNLSITAQYVTEERMARALGPNDELVAFSFTGRSLIGRQGIPGLNYFDVRVKTVQGLPSSPAAQQAMVTDLIQAGLFNPRENAKDRQMLLRLLSLGSTESHIDGSRVHRSRQLHEISQISLGVPVVVQKFHDHEIHLDELDKFRNSTRYDELPEDVKAQLEIHAETHKQMLAVSLVEPQINMQRAMALATQQTPQLLGGGNEESQQQGQVRQQ